MAYTCGNCGKTEESLKHCAKCASQYYCSRDCQKAQWKTHKKACAVKAAINANEGGVDHHEAAAPPSCSSHKNTAATAATPLKNLTGAVADPFHRLHVRTWLHDRPERDVYKLLIDAFRLRLDDDYRRSGGVGTEGSVYAGDSTGLPAFLDFLARVEARPGLLPPWWDAEKRAACVRLGINVDDDDDNNDDDPGKEDGDGWYSLLFALEERACNGHYGCGVMATQMRMFAEKVYGMGPAGGDGPGEKMMRAMMLQERDGGHAA